MQAMNATIQRTYAPVSFTAVTIDDEFWAPRIRANRERTIPIEYDQCKITGRIDALRLGLLVRRDPGEAQRRLRS